MELEGAKRCFSFLQETAKLPIPVFISDRHTGISKWIREQHPNTKTFMIYGMCQKLSQKQFLKRATKMVVRF